MNCLIYFLYKHDWPSFLYIFCLAVQKLIHVKMDDGGFEANFVDKVPDNLKCVICHFALKDPVQIALCGHRFCKSCFDNLKDYSERR